MQSGESPVIRQQGGQFGAMVWCKNQTKPVSPNKLHLVNCINCKALYFRLSGFFFYYYLKSHFLAFMEDCGQPCGWAERATAGVSAHAACAVCRGFCSVDTPLFELHKPPGSSNGIPIRCQHVKFTSTLSARQRKTAFGI